jgi:ankyrin repeat protein
MTSKPPSKPHPPLVRVFDPKRIEIEEKKKKPLVALPMQEWLPVNLVTRAESGDLDAMFELGEFGSAFQVNNTVHWLVRAASGGHARAMVSLAFLSAAPVDASSAIDWLRSAIKQLGVNAVNDDGVSLCHRAVAHSRADLLECLIAAGADVNVVDKLGRTPCHAAALSGNDPFVRRLIAAGANVAAQDTSGRTPLHAAVWSGHDTIVDMLIVARSPLDALDNDGRSPCHDAVANSCESALRRLVAAGANVKTVDKHGRTPFHAAAINGCERMAEMLVAAGADVTTADHLGRTPLHDAVRFSRAAIVEALIATGVRVMATDNEGRTPCHDAVANFNEPVVHMLLGAGANVDAADNLGRKPLDTAPNSRARDAFNRMLFRCIGAGVVTRSFDAARAALGAARAVRGQLASLDVVAPLVAESTSGDGVFGAVAAICARDVEFADAERAFVAQQDILRAAEQIDAQVVAARDAARQQLVRVAASILESYESAPLGALHDARQSRDSRQGRIEWQVSAATCNGDDRRHV